MRQYGDQTLYKRDSGGNYIVKTEHTHHVEHAMGKLEQNKSFLQSLREKFSEIARKGLADDKDDDDDDDDKPGSGNMDYTDFRKLYRRLTRRLRRDRLFDRYLEEKVEASLKDKLGEFYSLGPEEYVRRYGKVVAKQTLNESDVIARVSQNVQARAMARHNAAVNAKISGNKTQIAKLMAKLGKE